MRILRRRIRDLLLPPRGVIVIETKGLAPGYVPPSASLTGGGNS